MSNAPGHPAPWPPAPLYTALRDHGDPTPGLPVHGGHTALHGRLYAHAKLREIDPTRTKTLRRRFSGDARKRFRAIRGLIRDAIINKRALGDLSPPSPETAMAIMAGDEPEGPVRLQVQQATPARPGQFDFPRSSEKVEAFMDWLNAQMRAEVLEVTEGPARRVTGENAWTAKYVRASYRQGMQRAANEMQQAGVDPPDEDLDRAFQRPIHADRVGLLYTRAFDELRGITEATGQAVSRVLSQGIAEGKNPRVIARDLNRRVTAIGENRARIMARTEVVRAHHVATINSYREAGLETATVKAEWATAGDDRVCQRCQRMEGRVFTLDEIEGEIPLHPQCRCVALPIVNRQQEREAARARRAGSQRPGANR